MSYALYFLSRRSLSRAADTLTGLEYVTHAPPYFLGHSLYPNSSMIRAPEIVENFGVSM